MPRTVSSTFWSRLMSGKSAVPSGFCKSRCRTPSHLSSGRNGRRIYCFGCTVQQPGHSQYWERRAVTHTGGIFSFNFTPVQLTASPSFFSQRRGRTPCLFRSFISMVLPDHAIAAGPVIPRSCHSNGACGPGKCPSSSVSRPPHPDQRKPSALPPCPAMQKPLTLLSHQ